MPYLCVLVSWCTVRPRLRNFLIHFDRTTSTRAAPPKLFSGTWLRLDSIRLAWLVGIFSAKTLTSPRLKSNKCALVRHILEEKVGTSRAHFFIEKSKGSLQHYPAILLVPPTRLFPTSRSLYDDGSGGPTSRRGRRRSRRQYGGRGGSVPPAPFDSVASAAGHHQYEHRQS